MSCQCGDQARPAFDGETMKCTLCNKVWDDPAETTQQQPPAPQYPEPTAQTTQQPKPNYYEDIEDPQLKRELDKVRARYNRKQRNPESPRPELTWKAYGGWLLSTFLLVTLITVMIWR